MSDSSDTIPRAVAEKLAHDINTPELGLAGIYNFPLSSFSLRPTLFSPVTLVYSCPSSQEIYLGTVVSVTLTAAEIDFAVKHRLTDAHVHMHLVFALS